MQDRFIEHIDRVEIQKKFIEYIDRVELQKNKIALRLAQTKTKQELPFFPDYKNVRKVEKLEKFLKHLKDYETNNRTLSKNDVDNYEFYTNHCRAVLALLEQTEKINPVKHPEFFSLIVPKSVSYQRTNFDIFQDFLALMGYMAFFASAIGAIFGLVFGVAFGFS
ncbi:MAG: hypothetical protein H0U73_08305, partial [Tatlockia sp.]|nr:hypothetical protein [Tatlockia sp.]